MRLELLDRRRHRIGELGVGRLERVRKDRAVGEIDAGDVVAHVVERGAADAEFAAIGLALADLVGEPHGAVEQALRRQRHVAKLAMKIVEMLDQRIGIALDIGPAGAEQLGLDGMETAVGVGPGIDQRIEFRNEAGGEHFRPLPAGAGREPGLLGAGQIVGGDAFAQIPRAGQRRSDALDHVGPVAFGRLIKRRGAAPGTSRRPSTSMTSARALLSSRTSNSHDISEHETKAAIAASPSRRGRRRAILSACYAVL